MGPWGAFGGSRGRLGAGYRKMSPASKLLGAHRGPFGSPGGAFGRPLGSILAFLGALLDNLFSPLIFHCFFSPSARFPGGQTLFFCKHSIYNRCFLKMSCTEKSGFWIHFDLDFGMTFSLNFTNFHVFLAPFLALIFASIFNGK